MMLYGRVLCVGHGSESPHWNQVSCPVKHEKEEEALTLSVVCAAVIIPPM